MSPLRNPDGTWPAEALPRKLVSTAEKCACGNVIDGKGTDHCTACHRKKYDEFNAAGLRRFESGATRNRDDGQPDYEGFLSPTALARYGVYMHAHRIQADGSLRASDDWQKGIPQREYLKSLLRHVMDVWLCFRGGQTRESLEDALCATIFNSQGLLHEVLKESGGGIL
jgi:hypothetical protein